MIRDRRKQDLPLLCEVIDELGDQMEGLARSQPRRWLQEIEAECSWVFDQAPVTAAPTRNVIGHAQIYGAPDATWTRDVATALGKRADELLVIGRVFVGPVRYRDNITRYLLRESVRYAHRQGRVAVLAPESRKRAPTALPERLGFSRMATVEGVPLVCSPHG